MKLLERDEQLRAAAGYGAEASHGHGRLVYVTGEAGVGKTTFVGRVIEDARDQARVALGGCDGSATPAPLGPLVEMLPQLPPEVWPEDATREEMFARLLAALRQPPDGVPYLLGGAALPGRRPRVLQRARPGRLDAYLLGWLARLQLDRGEVPEARSTAESVLRRAELAVIDSIEPPLVLGQAATRAGEPEGSDLIDRALELAAGTGEVQRIAPSTSAACEAAWISGDDIRSESLAGDSWPTTRTSDCPWSRGSVATWLGPEVTVSAAELAPPYAAERTGRWVDAAELWRAAGCPFEQALALARSGQQDRLTEAVAIFDRLGAAAAAARTRALMRA